MTETYETTRRTNGADSANGLNAQPAEARFGSRVIAKFIVLLSKCFSVLWNRMTRPFVRSEAPEGATQYKYSDPKIGWVHPYYEKWAPYILHDIKPHLKDGVDLDELEHLIAYCMQFFAYFDTTMYVLYPTIQIKTVGKDIIHPFYQKIASLIVDRANPLLSDSADAEAIERAIGYGLNFHAEAAVNSHIFFHPDENGISIFDRVASAYPD